MLYTLNKRLNFLLLSNFLRGNGGLKLDSVSLKGFVKKNNWQYAFECIAINFYCRNPYTLKNIHTKAMAAYKFENNDVLRMRISTVSGAQVSFKSEVSDNVDFYIFNRIKP